MADRRGDDRPLAPHRPLSGSPAAAEEDPARGGLSKKMAAAVAAAGSAVRGAGPTGTAANPRPPQQPQPTGQGAAGQGPAGQGPAGQGPSGRGPAGGSTARTAATEQSTGRPTGTPRPRGTRRARLRLVHLDPWSVMKTAFLLSVALGIVLVVAVAVVWSVLGAAGVWDSINKTVSDVLGGTSTTHFDVKNYVGTSRVLGFTMVVAVVDVVLITAISTLGAFLYNLAAALLGGIDVTLAEDDR